ncbi:MAG: carboxymuconolactone decarboxylase family protein [Candidatus Methanomethylophilus sp.]|nr:carboxymuconolactone decarboxylase family protein [Methanomethylophilus sp.]
MVEIDKTFEEAIAEVQTNGAKQTAADWLAKIEEEYGRSPLIYQKLEDNPEALISHLLYKNSVTRAGALPPKTVELISLAVGAALRCDHCTTYHMQVAKKMGITKEEILEAVLIAGLLANSSVLANAYRLVVPEKEPCVGTCAVQ